MGKPSVAKGMKTDQPVKSDERDYEAENAHDTLQRAHEIMANEDLMPRVKKIAGAKAKSATALNDMLAAKKAKESPYNSVADLKKASVAMRKKAQESV